MPCHKLLLWATADCAHLQCELTDIQRAGLLGSRLKCHVCHALLLDNPKCDTCHGVSFCQAEPDRAMDHGESRFNLAVLSAGEGVTAGLGQDSLPAKGSKG